jgi:hypothetical protein
LVRLALEGVLGERLQHRGNLEPPEKAQHLRGTHANPARHHSKVRFGHRKHIVHQAPPTPPFLPDTFNTKGLLYGGVQTHVGDLDEGRILQDQGAASGEV